MTKSVFVCLTMHQKLKECKAFLAKQRLLGDINEPKMGCIHDKLILFSATDSRRTCMKFTEISVQNQVGKKFSKTNVR